MRSRSLRLVGLPIYVAHAIHSVHTTVRSASKIVRRMTLRARSIVGRGEQRVQAQKAAGDTPATTADS
jgi:hypothetical protein